MKIRVSGVPYEVDMPDLRKAAEMALKYFEDAYGVDVIEFEIKEALRQALEESANSTTDFVEPKAPSQAEQKQGVIAYRTGYDSGYMDASVAAKREWVGLTDEDLEPMCDDWRIVFGSYVHDFAKAIEAKLKEKNT